MRKVAVIGAAILIAVAAASQVQAEGPADRAPVIQVTGTGSVQAEPDMATIRAGVSTEDASAQDALARNTAATQKMLKELEAASIDKKDLKTSNFSVYPQYRSDGDKRQLTGYRVSNTIVVTIRDTTKVGAILTRIVSAGSNQIGGPNFSVSDPEKYLNEARKKAVENGMAKAAAYASAAGLKLGAIVEMSEAGTPGPIFAHAAGAVRTLAAPVPVETGMETIQAQIAMVIGLKSQ